jgi:short-subunit dehydrogenase
VEGHELGEEKVRRGIPAAAAVAAIGVAAARRIQTRTPLDGRTAIVTGASRGLGLAIARELAASGSRVVICARDSAHLESAANGLRDHGADVLALPCDVSDPAQAQMLVDRAAAHFGDVDILVNNAGVIQVGPLAALTLDDFREAMDSMFWGTVNTTLAALPAMRKRRRGHIVNITSIGGKISVPRLLPYNSAKFAAVGFSEGLHAEAARDGIRVTTVVPGLMRTGSDVQARFAGDAAKEYGWFSTAAAMPVLTIDGRTAARRIVRAVRSGRNEIVLTVPAKIAVRVHGVAPALTQTALTVANRLLPGPSASGRSERGLDVARRTPLARRLSRMNRRAGRALNQPEPA